ILLFSVRTRAGNTERHSPSRKTLRCHGRSSHRSLYKDLREGKSPATQEGCAVWTSLPVHQSRNTWLWDLSRATGSVPRVSNYKALRVLRSAYVRTRAAGRSEYDTVGEDYI